MCIRDRVTRLGVQVDPSVTDVTCEWQSAAADLRMTTTFALAPEETSAASAAALVGGEGHLAEAQAASVGGSGGWTVDSPPMESGARYRYRFHAFAGTATAEQSTDWYDLAPTHWTSEPVGQLTGPDERLVPGSVAWLVSDLGIHRVRFALRLGDGDHVVGFGERFDRVDPVSYTHLTLPTILRV